MRIDYIPYKEVKRQMLIPNYFKFISKYNLFVDDTLPRLSDTHLEKIVNFWQQERVKISLANVKNNTIIATPVWTTIENITSTMSNLINWREYLAQYENPFLLKEKEQQVLLYNSSSTVKENKRLTLESELSKYNLQEEINNDKKEKLTDIENRRSHLIQDMNEIGKEYSFIQQQINELQKEEIELMKETED